MLQHTCMKHVRRQISQHSIAQHMRSTVLALHFTLPHNIHNMHASTRVHTIDNNNKKPSPPGKFALPLLTPRVKLNRIVNRGFSPGLFAGTMAVADFFRNLLLYAFSTAVAILCICLFWFMMWKLILRNIPCIKEMLNKKQKEKARQHSE